MGINSAGNADYSHFTGKQQMRNLNVEMFKKLRLTTRWRQIEILMVRHFYP